MENIYPDARLMNRIIDFFEDNEDYDVNTVDGITNIKADLFDTCTGVVAYLNEKCEELNDHCTLTDQGRRRTAMIMRHDDLLEKYHNMSITLDEYAELIRLKEELN